MSSQPKTVYLKDYTPPSHVINTTYLTVELGEYSTLVTSKLSVTRNPAATTAADLALHGGEEIELVSVKIDDATIEQSSLKRDGEMLTILQTPESFNLEIQTRIKPQENTTLEGLYQSGGMFCTQCEAEGFRHITFYPDRPDVMSKFTTKIIGDKAKYPVLLANGNNVDSGDLDNGQHYAVWEDPFNKPAYLFAMVAGQLDHIEDSFTTQSGRNVTLRLFVEPHNMDKTAHGMACLKNAFDWDEKAYGREYDLDIFMIVAVDDFNMGAMENKGLNIFNSAVILANPQTSTDTTFKRIDDVVAHEYFHNWSGNRVTCRDWFQLSLKEGFTVLREQQYSADQMDKTVKRIEDVDFLRTVQFPEDAGPMAHPIRPSSFMEINNFYTMTVYEKGSEVLRMMHTIVGEEKWRKGSDIYFDRHDGQAVTTEDFLKAIEDGSNTNLKQFSTWYNQAGTPEVTVTDVYDATAQTYTLNFKQSTRATPECAEKKPFIIPVKLGLVAQNGSDITLKTDHEAFNVNTNVFLFTEAEQNITFTNVTEKPTPSLFRQFSAPVTLNYAYTEAELMFLMAHDSDGFNRWEAGQTLAKNTLVKLTKAVLNNEELTLGADIIGAFKAVITDANLSNEMIACMVGLPTESIIAETIDLADPDAIHTAHNFMKQAIAAALEDALKDIYNKLNTNRDYAYTPSQVGDRKLKNTCLSYLLSLDTDMAIQLAETQFNAANNMTDKLAALSGLVNCDAATAQAKIALDSFYSTWKHDNLVMEQWLRVQSAASSKDNLTNVQKLMQHEAFDMGNPNKVRSVIGGFCASHNNFHNKNGSGYTFLADQILVLNKSNPQIASRLLNPFTKWRSYEANRQTMIKAQLERILAEPDLSKNVYEIASKSI